MHKDQDHNHPIDRLYREKLGNKDLMPLPDAKDRFLKRAGGQYEASGTSRFMKKIRGLFDWSKFLLVGSVILNIYLVYHIYQDPGTTTPPEGQQERPEGKGAPEKGGPVAPDTVERIHRDTVMKKSPENSGRVPEEGSGKSHDPAQKAGADHAQPSPSERNPKEGGSESGNTDNDTPALTQQTKPGPSSPDKGTESGAGNPSEQDPTNPSNPQKPVQEDTVSVKGPASPGDVSPETSKQKDTIGGKPASGAEKEAGTSSEEEKKFGNDLEGFKKREQKEVEKDTSNKIFIEE